MTFDLKYQAIASLVSDEMVSLNIEIAKLFCGKTPLDVELLRFLSQPSKRLRPVLGFLFLKALYGQVNQQQSDILVAVELIHNASLIHDDVIDDADKRRSGETFNAKFDADLAVVAGDFLLSIALEKIIEAGNIDVLKLFTSALKQTCEGEISQYFTKFKIPSIDDYIEKSKKKTALLFEIGILSGIHLSDKNNNLASFEKAKEFAENFGIAFQIRDDLINVSKVTSDDIEAGIYTAPVIFAAMENNDILATKNIKNVIIKTNAIEKTKSLIDNYFTSAKLALNDLEEGIYKETLVKLIDLLNWDL